MIELNKEKDSYLGKTLRCTVTGFVGVAISKIEYINGCYQYCLKPPVDKDNKMVDGQYIDVEQLELLDDKIKVTKRSNTGGSKTDAPKGL